MKLVFTSHAVERMQQRKLSPQEVELVLTSPDGKIAQTKDKVVFYKKLAGRKDNLVAAVTVIRKDDLLEVITVMVHFEVKK